MNHNKLTQRRRRLEEDIVFYGLCISILIMALLIVWWVLTTAEGRYTFIGAVGMLGLVWAEVEKRR